MRIRDVVTQNDKAEFANDVQLAWYPSDPRNLPLVQGYMFTREAIEGKIPSIRLLEILRDSFLWGSENRHVVIATYGHGKSHLAIVLANYFGKPLESQEVLSVLGSIKSVADAGKAASFREFRDGRPPFLVIRMSGDQPQSIHQQFLMGLQQAIEEHDGARGTVLPFWFASAEKFLSHLTGESLDRANEHLKAQNTDVAGLLAQVRQKDQTVYDQCVSVFTQVVGVTPQFGGEISIDQTIRWAAESLCSDEKPIAGGILVLFDEFSAFVHRYAERMGASASSLQDLLNGVQNCQRKAVFVAFSQHDPDAVARDVHRGAGDKQDSLLKELERLPVAQRYNLYSSLETVLDSYLKQDDVAYDQVYDQAIAAFQSATDNALQLLRPRYDDQMGWGVERFDSTVTRGCFPLHPLTTGLFCTVDLKQVTNTRSVLGFVLTELQKRYEEPAILDGMPNWVYGTALVDWFHDMLADREYQEYESAVRHAGPEIPQVQKAVLKALLLYGVGRLQKGALSYETAIAQLCGFPIAEARKALEDMRSAGYIRFDQARKAFTFWPANSGATKIEEMVRKELQGKSFEYTHLAKINRDPQFVSAIEVEGVNWGNSLEWAANEVYLTRRFFTASHIQRLCPRFHIDAKHGFVEGVRGCVVRLIAESDDDVEYFREHADEILSEALGDTPPPVILAVPIEPRPNLTSHFLTYFLLDEWEYSKRSEVSMDAYNDKKNRVLQDIKDDLNRLRGSVELLAPKQFRALLVSKNALTSVQRALPECYALAYPFAPKPYFVQHKASGTRYRDAVSVVAQALGSNKLAESKLAIENNPVAKDLVSKFLQTNGWAIVAYNNLITVPTETRFKQAWSHLDTVFGPGKESVPIRDAIIPLLNPPYGYDAAQAALLFHGWHGYNRRDIKLITASGTVTIEMYSAYLKPATDFIRHMCALDNVRLSRRDPLKEEEEVKGLIARAMKETYSQADALKVVRELQAFAAKEATDSDLGKSASGVAATLQSHIDIAKKYGEESGALVRLLATESAIERLLPLDDRIKALPTLGHVDDGYKSRTDLNKILMNKIVRAVEQRCATLSKLSTVADYALNLRNLEILKGKLIGLHRPDLVKFVEDATVKLKETRTRLEATAKDEKIEVELNGMRTNDGLAVLRGHLARLDQLTPVTSETTAKVEDKRHALKNSIAKAQAFVSGLGDRIASEVTASGIDRIRQDVLRAYSSFETTPEVKLLDGVTKRCDEISDFLRDLSAWRAEPINKPEDVVRLESRLKEILQANAAILSKTQAQLFVGAREHLDRELAAKRTAAVQWLQSLEKRASKGENPAQLLRELEAPHCFIGDEYAERVRIVQDALTERINADRKDSELKAKDAPILARVDSMSSDVSLSVLRASITALDSLDACLPATREAIVKKRQSLIKAATALEQLPASVSSRLDDAKAPGQVRGLSQELNRIHDKFLDTEELATVKGILARCEHLEAFFTTLSDFERLPTNCPSDAENAKTALDQLAEKYGPSLSSKQGTLISAVKSRTSEHVARKVQEANSWLIARQKDASDGKDATKILQSLQSPPAFLPSSSTAVVEELRRRANDRVNEDEVERVASHFRNITDKAKRIACLAALQAIAKELGD